MYNGQMVNYYLILYLEITILLSIKYNIKNIISRINIDDWWHEDWWGGKIKSKYLSIIKSKIHLMLNYVLMVVSLKLNFYKNKIIIIIPWFISLYYEI